MVNGELIYKGFKGSIEYSENDQVYYGRILNIPDLVSYEGKILIEFEQSFIEAVDEYIYELGGNEFQT